MFDLIFMSAPSAFTALFVVTSFGYLSSLIAPAGACYEKNRERAEREGEWGVEMFRSAEINVYLIALHPEGALALNMKMATLRYSHFPPITFCFPMTGLHSLRQRSLHHY